MTVGAAGGGLPGPREFDAPRGERTAADGLLVVDKPQGWTSHDVVARVRRMAATKKVGHAGTLDPMATGVLVLGIGRATKLLTWVVGEAKTYTATIRLGASTLTDDAEGEVTSAPGIGASINAAALEAAMAPLRGDISQVPSSVSAIKVDGQRSYARVRAGEEVALAAREVTVGRFEVTGEAVEREIETPDGGVRVLDVPVVVDCSSGTYIRALARDLGAALGVGGHLTALRREAVGAYRVEDAATLDVLARAVAGAGELSVLGLTDSCRALFPVRRLDAAETAAVRVGKFLAPTGAVGEDGADAVIGGSGRADRPVAAVDPDGAVVALLTDKGGAARPVLVLRPV